MTYPPGVSEQSFLTAVDHIAGILSAKFQYGYHDKEDVAQIAAAFALEALPKYESSKGNLEGFLFRHCSNRLSNNRRDELGCRSDPPCRICYQHALGRGTGHPDGSVCPKFQRWWERRLTRARIAGPVSMELVADEGEHRMRIDSSAEAEAAGQELLDLIDSELPVELRADYLRMLAGDKTFTDCNRRRLVREEVSAILAEAGVEVDVDKFESLALKGYERREGRQREADGMFGDNEVWERVDDDEDEQEVE